MNIFNRSILLYIVLLITFNSCSNDEKSADPPLYEGTQIMNDSIKSILSQSNLVQSTYENSLRTAAIKNQLTQSNDPMLYFNYAKESLNAGNTTDAINTIQNLIQSSNAIVLNPQNKMLHEFLALCYLRMGEQENCQDNHNDQSCIVPIDQAGVHIKEAGSRKAIEKYLEILAQFPNDYQSRWLLNLAYMTLDEYPEKVASQYLINIHQEDGKDVLFQNVATQLGVDEFDLSGGVITDDFNNDGLIDILCSSWGLKGSVKYFENTGKSGFVDKTVEAGLSKVQGGLNLKQADIDNDGDLDFIILRGAWRPNLSWGILPNSLMQNNGEAIFTDITMQSGVYSRKPSQSAEWIDYNNDGLIDLFVANETTASSSQDFPCALYKNLGNSKFTNVAVETGTDHVGYFKGVSSGDINNDGYRDLYITNLSGDNILLKNNEGSRFQNITQSAQVKSPFASFPCWFFDANNDGWDDLFVSSFDQLQFNDQSGQFALGLLNKPLRTESLKFYLNNGDETFADKTTSYLDFSSIGTMGCNYGDVDNDGFPDFYLGTGAPDYRSVVPNRFFMNREGKHFDDRTYAMGLGHIQKGHAISFADFDNDGDQDIYAVMGGAFEGDVFPNALFNNAGNDNNWLKLRLRGKSSNAAAIGAKIEVNITSGGSKRTVYHTVGSGASFGANSIIAHIGLGKASSIESIKIKWPNKTMLEQSYMNFEMNSFYNIYEDQANPEFVQLDGFDFAKNKKKSHSHKHH